MKKLVNLVSLGLLTTLVGCGQDVGKSSRRPVNNPEVTRPPVDASTSASVRSGLVRESGSPSLTYSSEITQTINGTLPFKSYKTIPRMEKDDEGSSKNVTTLGQLVRPATACGSGTTFNNVTERIADCLTKNPNNAVWDGEKYGAAGEGTWKLVSKSSASKEIWLDTTTGMVWSYLITNGTTSAFNWCKASGNSQGATSTEAVDCAKESQNISVCSGQFFEETDKNVIWRLPTRNDFLQADLDGLRFVLTRESDVLWTATMRAVSEKRTEAWVYSSADGTLSFANLKTEHQVRCIGAPVM